MILKQENIPYGPRHRAALEAFCGLPAGTDLSRIWRQFANCVYERPAWGATLLPTGRVLVCVERVYDDCCYLLADRDAFDAWRAARERGVLDPETGRAR